MKRAVLFLVLMAFDTNASKLNLVDLAADSMTNFSCVNYKVKGVCFWLKCSLTGCKIKTSTLVEHNNPDMVVDVSQTEERPLDPFTSLLLENGAEVSKIVIGDFNVGTGNQLGKTRDSSNLQFHDAVAMGNPMLSVFDSTVGSVLGSMGWCRSIVTPLNPYFVSTASPEWRKNWLEGPMWAPNMFRKLGGVTKPYWGSIYPRIGFIHNADTFKSSATISQRVADIVSNPGSLHIALPLPMGSPGNKTWKPIKIKESDSSNSIWQLNYPRGYSDECKVFPHSLPESGIKSDTKNYVWTLWRRYECCSRRGSYISKKVF